MIRTAEDKVDCTGVGSAVVVVFATANVTVALGASLDEVLGASEDDVDSHAFESVVGADPVLVVGTAAAEVSNEDPGEVAMGSVGAEHSTRVAPAMYRPLGQAQSVNAKPPM